MSDDVTKAEIENSATLAQDWAEKAQKLAEDAKEASQKAADFAAKAKQEALEHVNAVAEQAATVTQGDSAIVLASGVVSGAGAGLGAVDPFVFQFAIFVMAIFVGYYVVWSVTPALHTPLMSVTNAISSVIVVGALLAVGLEAAGFMATALGFGALVLASINIFGGFLVTQRMLAMYKKKER